MGTDSLKSDSSLSGASIWGISMSIFSDFGACNLALFFSAYCSIEGAFLRRTFRGRDSGKEGRPNFQEGIDDVVCCCESYGIFGEGALLGGAA